MKGGPRHKVQLLRSKAPVLIIAPSPGIPILERRKGKQQHLKQCINDGISRYKKKYQKPGVRLPTINSRLDLAYMNPTYRKFFGDNQGDDGLLDKAKLLKAFSGDTLDTRCLIFETLQFHKEALLKLLHTVSPKLELSDDEHKQILTKSLQMIIEWLKDDTLTSLSLHVT